MSVPTVIILKIKASFVYILRLTHKGPVQNYTALTSNHF